jgi:hypothetical protein
MFNEVLRLVYGVIQRPNHSSFPLFSAKSPNIIVFIQTNLNNNLFSIYIHICLVRRSTMSAANVIT